MKINQCVYLASLNIKRNKNRTIRTVIGLSIGLSMIILSLFLILSFRNGLLGYLENNRLFNSINVRYGYNSKLTEDDVEALKKLDGITSTISYRQFTINNKINDGIDIIIGDNTYNISEITMNSVDKITDDEINQYSYEVNNEPFIKYGTSNVNEGEILISNKILNITNHITNETPESIVGKNISILVPKVDNRKEKEYLLKDFKIVGVYNQLNKTKVVNNIRIDDDNTSYLGFEELYNNYEKVLPYGDNFIVNKKSLLEINYITKENKKDIINPITNEISTITNYYDVPEYEYDYYQEEAINNKKVDIAGRSDFFYYTRIYFENFDYALRAYENIKTNYNNEMNINSTNKWNIYDVSLNEDFVEFIVYHRVISNISYFILFISIIITFISLLNIFNTIGYNVHKNESQIGFMKALGLKDKEVFKTYVAEFFIYLFISFIISFFITLIISIITTILINDNFITTRSYVSFVDTKNINIGYYFLSFFIVLLIIGLISYVYTRIITKNVVNNKITVLIKK